MLRNESTWETAALTGAVRAIRDVIPSTWQLMVSNADIGTMTDAVLSIASPQSTPVTFALETKRSRSAVATLVAFLQKRQESSAAPLLYVSDYLGPSLRSALEAERISYADATGWVRLVSDAPLMLITGRGSDRAPLPAKPSAITRLNGIAAGRIVRTLAVTDTPIGVRELATAADVSPGSVSKLLPTLAAEGIIDRDARGPVETVRRRPLIARWAQDYAFASTNPQVAYYLAPRGIARALTLLSESTDAIALTGSAAAQRLLPDDMTSVVPLRLLALYARDPVALATELGLVPTQPATANMVIAVPQDARVLDQKIAPIPVVLADLLTLPGRGEAEATQLMDALTRAVPGWAA